MFAKRSKAFSFTLFAGLAILMAWAPTASASEPFIGQIMIVGFNFAPRGWAHCNGQLLSISSNTALFSLLGTIYGGDGRTTFALPDLRGRVAIHMGTGPGLSPYQIGQRGGAQSVVLNVHQMPAHNHGATAHADSGRGNKDAPAGHVWSTKRRDRVYSDRTPDVTMSASAVTVHNNGGGQAHENRQPYLTVNYVIALQGIFPSRN